MWMAFNLTDRRPRELVDGSRDAAKAPTDLSPELVDRVLAQAKEMAPSVHAALTGSEPVLHPRLDAILDVLCKHGCTWHVGTGGTHFDRLIARVQRDCTLRDLLTGASINLDGADEATHDAIHGSGSFREAMKAITLCEMHNVPVRIETSINKLNADEVERITLAASHLGAVRLGFGVTFPTGSPHDARLALTPAELRSVQDRIDRVSNSVNLSIEAADGFYRPQLFHVCAPFRCVSLHVDSRGRLTLCSYLSGAAGDEGDVVADLHTVPLAQAHQNLLELIHACKLARLNAVRSESLTGPWAHFPCNACRKSFGKPYWADSPKVEPVVSVLPGEIVAAELHGQGEPRAKDS